MNKTLSVTSKSVDAFLCDENYLALVESAREQRLLFITDMSETRVSAFLGWMFRPHEGHGLGDQAIRELLHNAWKQVNSGEWEGPTAHEMGFKDWTPSRIATKSFRDLCVETEYRFGGKSSERPVDVALVSRVNKLVILIENKFGSTVHSGQLTAYRRQAKQAFPGYSIFRIYLDPNDENKPDDPPYWINLRYDWLIDLIAVRQQSGLLSERALNALSQVKDYLEQESADQGRSDRQAQIALLAEEHNVVLEEMKRLKKLGRHARLTATRDVVEVVSEILLVEYHQRHVLWDDVFSQMSHVKLIEAIKEDMEIRKLPKRLRARSSEWSEIRNPVAKKESAWGIRLAAWKPDETKNVYNVRSVISFEFIQSIDGGKVPPYTAEQEKSLRLISAELREMTKKSAKDDRWIRLKEEKNLKPEDAARVMIEEKNRIDKALKSHQLLKERE